MLQNYCMFCLFTSFCILFSSPDTIDYIYVGSRSGSPERKHSVRKRPASATQVKAEPLSGTASPGSSNLATNLKIKDNTVVLKKTTTTHKYNILFQFAHILQSSFHCEYNMQSRSPDLVSFVLAYGILVQFMLKLITKYMKLNHYMCIYRPSVIIFIESQ